MQQPLPQPQPDADQNQARDQHMPNLWRSRGGCYPRWWLIAAFLTILLVCFGMILWSPVICPAQTTGLRLPICYITTWPTLAQIPLLWLLFGILGLLAFLLGVSLIEVPRRESNGIADFVRSASEFAPLHPLLVLQGCIALAIIVALWWIDFTPALAFALLSTLVFIAHCSAFYRRTPQVRRYYLMGYGFLSLVALAIGLLLKHYLQNGIPQGDQPLLACEALLFLIGIWAIFWRPRPAAPLTAQEALEEDIAQAATPLGAFRSMPVMNRIWPNRPVQANNQQNPANPVNPPPGVGAP